jgi:hypothetical protein
MPQGVTIDVIRGRSVASLLMQLFDTMGVHGRTDMPQDAEPAGIARGSREHLVFITLAVSLAYQRDAQSLWESARYTYLDPQTRYLFDLQSVTEATLSEIRRDLKKHGLSKKSKNDAYIWKTNAVSFHRKWADDPRKLLERCNWDCSAVLHRLQDRHPFGGTEKADYPSLKEPRIGALWLRMLADNAGLSRLRNLDKVSVPADSHVARATLATGVVRGRFKGDLRELVDRIREAWFGGVKGLTYRGRPMVAIDVGECLWNLSKHGCSHRRGPTSLCHVSETCQVREFCIGERILIDNGHVEMDT